MKILVAVASRHAATAEIAAALGARLQARGHQVDVRDLEEPTSPDGYDAVVLGSAVYAGRWLKAARSFAEQHATALVATRVWLFSSGPLDDPDAEVLAPATLDDLLSSTGAVEHHVFPGRLDRAQLGRAERLLTRVVHAPSGDFRDWDAVTGWADRISDALALAVDGARSPGGPRQPAAPTSSRRRT